MTGLPPPVGSRCPARRGEICAPPSARILAAILCAYAAASAFPELRRFSAFALPAGVFLFALLASAEVLAFSEAEPPRASRSAGIARGAVVFAAVWCVALARFYMGVPENPYPGFAPREASVSARISDVSRGKNGSLYGTAEVVSSKDLPLLAGQPLWFVVSDGKGGLRNPPELRPSAVAVFNGAVYPTGGARCRSRGHSDQKSRDFDGYLEGKFVHYKIFAPSSGVEVEIPASPRFGFYAKIAEYMDSSLSALPAFMSADSEAAKTYRAMMLGDKSLLAPAQKDAFARAGVMHVFAISGLHVGFAAGILYFALSALGAGRRIQPLVALPALFLYVAACGGRPSAMRAFGMVAVVWLASLLGRGAKPVDAITLAAIVSLAVFPRDIGDAGFALSYCVAASIFVYSLPLFERVSEAAAPRVLYGGFFRRAYSGFRRKFFDFAAGGICISLGCSMAAFPLSAHYFGYASLASALYSPLFVFGSGIAVSLGFAGFFLPDFAAQWLNAVSCAVVGVMNKSALALNSAADMSVDFSIKSGFAAGVAALAFLFFADLSGRLGRRAAGFFLAPAAMGALIMLYKLAE